MEDNSKLSSMTESVNVKEILWRCLYNWYWFIISVALCAGAVYLYVRQTPPKYTRNAQLLIKNDSNSKSNASELAFADLDMFKIRANISNEIMTIHSLDNMKEVVRRLGLNTEFFVYDDFYNKLSYGSSQPVKIDFFGLEEDASAQFDLETTPSGDVILSNFQKNGDPLNSKVLKAKLDQVIATPIGKLTVSPLENYNVIDHKPMKVVHIPVESAASRFLNEVSVTLSEEKSSILDMKCVDCSKERASDILNTMVDSYNDMWVEDRNQVAVSTSQFIDERLAVIENELGSVDSDISSFKSANLVPDVESASNMYMKEATDANSKIMELNNQLAMGQYVKDYLTTSGDDFRIIPSGTGFENAGISSQVAEYNSQVARRNNLVANSSVQNPVVKDMDITLIELRRSIISSIDNQLHNLRTQLRSQESKESRAVSQIASNPQQAKYLLSVERQQKVKESLYLYLLQKREENELSQAFSAYNTRIITAPNGPVAPTEPVTRNLYMVAIVIGLLLPLAIIYLREMMNSKVRSRKDLELLSVPLVGEIPQFMPKDGMAMTLIKKIPMLDNLGSKKAKHATSSQPVVTKGNRNIINEAFRVLRTNLDFMASGGNQNIFTITSFNPGSGKSFISVNLAVCCAISGKKVLCIDGDLRHGSLSKYFGNPKEGMSNYLSGNIDDFSQVIYHSKEHPNLDFIPTGKLPPNPTELLEDERLKQLLEAVKPDYDFIFIDCPPSDIVADTHIIEQMSDRTLFVIRAGLLEKIMLEELERFYQEKKFKNMSVILNGTEAITKRYGSHGYGYGYGYGYYSNYYSN